MILGLWATIIYIYIEVPSSSFTRYLSTPSIYLEMGVDRDSTAPSRIMDLRILRDVGLDRTKKLKVQLVWTSPRDEGETEKGRKSTWL